MLGYFPKAYPDELIYSVLSRVYVGNGFFTYREFADEVQDNNRATPSIEFLGSLKEEIIDELINAYGVENIDDLIMQGTEYPYYTRFYIQERKVQALNAIKEKKKVTDLIRPTTQSKERFLRYCCECVCDDRSNYGETYWHRSHQLKGINVCSKHGSKLIDSQIVLAGKASPMYVSAETIIDDLKDMYVEVASSLELKLAKMHFDLLVAPYNHDVQPLNIIKKSLYEKGYYSPRAMSIHLAKIELDMNRFYNDFPSVGLNKAQISKLLSGKRRTPNEICIMALFLGLTTTDLMRECTFNIEERTKAFDTKVLEMIQEGYSVVGTAQILGMEKQMISSIKNGKRSSERSAVRGRGGAKPKDWNSLDIKYLPIVKETVDTMREKPGERPVRVTAYMVAKKMQLDYNSFLRLEKCNDYINKYVESQEEYWAREIEWAYHYINYTGEKMQYVSFRRLLNIKRSHMVSALPYIKDADVILTIFNLTEI